MAEDDEHELTALLRAGALDRAATLALEVYGAELYGFLVSTLRGETDAGEVFAQVSEDLWRGLPQFGARCSVRTWLYVLARNAASRFRRSPWNRGGLTGESGLDEHIARARSMTQPWQRTDVKDRWRALRDALDPDDQIILVLRVDRELSWEDVARVTLGTATPDAAALSRETDRVRKRFQLIKADLKRRAEKAGLLDEEG